MSEDADPQDLVAPLPVPLRPALSYSIGRSRTAILDSDYILNQVARIVEEPVAAMSSLGPPFQRGRCFASKHVLDELYQADKLGFRNKWEKLAAHAAENGHSTTPGAYQKVFEETFLKAITFVDVTGMFVDESAARVSDPHDRPTGQLAMLLSRSRPIVYSHDHSLWRPGLAPPPASFQAVVTAGFHADSGETGVQGLTYVAGGLVWAADGAARGVAAVLKVPSRLTRLALLAAGIFFFLDAGRRAKVVEILAPVGRVIEAELQRASDALGLLADSAADVEPDDRLECRITEILAAELPDSPLTAGEIRERLTSPRSQLALPTAGEIRALLRELPCFVEGPSSYFRLGSIYDS